MKPFLISKGSSKLISIVAATVVQGVSFVHAANYNDDFSAGAFNWQSGGAWSVQGTGSAATLTVNTQSDEFAWNSVIGLSRSWVIETEFTFDALYNDGNWTGTAGIALADSQNQLLYLADVIYSQDAYLYPGMGYYDGSWHNTLEPNEWHPGAQSTVKLRLERPPGSDRFLFTVSCENGFIQEYTSLPIPDTTLNQIAKIGLRGFRSQTSFDYVAVTTPLPVNLEIGMYPGVTLRGEPGTTYQIQYADSVDAETWLPLENVTLQSGEQMWFDTSETIGGRRFYRAVEQ